jgi:hypothetical protein
VLAPAERERLVRGAALVVEEPHVVHGELRLVLPTRVLAVNLAERRVVGTSLVARDLDGTEPFPAWPRVSVDGTHFRLTSADGGVASVELRPLLTAAERDQPRPIRWWRTRGHQLDVGLPTRTLEVAWASPPRPVESGLVEAPAVFLATSRDDPPLRVLVGAADAGRR